MDQNILPNPTSIVLNPAQTKNGPDFNYYEEYIFDKPYIRGLFIFLYTVVFCLCFFGNLLVILAVTLSRRLRRTTTNFFLANLAVADISVAVFCVYQNFFIYIIESWMLGEFLCKMYIFIQSLSNSASIVILVVISSERYFAIMYPMRCKQILTTIRLRIIIATVWIGCVFYSAPKFYFSNTVTVNTGDTNETVCVLNREKFDSKLFDMIHFVLLYLIPLAVISILYTKIAIRLWKSSNQLQHDLDASCNHTLSYDNSFRIENTKNHRHLIPNTQNGKLENLLVRSPTQASISHNMLKARKGVIKMLIIVVCAFALFNLPYHARKMWQYWSPNYKGHTNFSALFTPLTFLSAYFNSGINPLLYALLSKNFRGHERIVVLVYETKV
ncbi:hypothetical protein ABEB36_008016 [Hypothenemus hampei]|uniref:G-protein coupled receptors family 1 profile domain-containing protein n=1 Tax=Hypothenemus hampei TaxID=57062 RepID=A0ABD1EKY5_HYPHA